MYRERNRRDKMNSQVIKAYKKVLEVEGSYAESNCSLAKRREKYARAKLSSVIREHYPNLDQKSWIKLFTDLQEISKD